VVERAMQVLGTCARAQRARFQMLADGGVGQVYAHAEADAGSLTLVEEAPRLFPFNAAAERFAHRH
jgi:hypothetical protein